MNVEVRQLNPAQIKDYRISVIIPVLNEAENLAKLVPYLQEHGAEHLAEIVVADCNSTDGTADLLKSLQVVHLNCEKAGRASQMNAAASKSKGEILYFVHADTLPPKSFVADIKDSLSLGFGFGCYPFEFDVDRPLLRMNAWFTQLDKMWCRGGDQSLFITKEHFEAFGGFDEKQSIMEEYEFIKRVRKQLAFRIMKQARIVVSARKYQENSYLKVNLANFIAMTMWRLNMPAERIKRVYKRLLNQSRT